MRDTGQHLLHRIKDAVWRLEQEREGVALELPCLPADSLTLLRGAAELIEAAGTRAREDMEAMWTLAKAHKQNQEKIAELVRALGLVADIPVPDDQFRRAVERAANLEAELAGAHADHAELIEAFGDRGGETRADLLAALKAAGQVGKAGLLLAEDPGSVAALALAADLVETADQITLTAGSPHRITPSDLAELEAAADKMRAAAAMLRGEPSACEGMRAEAEAVGYAHLSDQRSGIPPAGATDEEAAAHIERHRIRPASSTLEVIGGDPGQIAALGLGLQQGVADVAPELGVLAELSSPKNWIPPLKTIPIGGDWREVPDHLVPEAEDAADETPEHVWTCPKHGPQRGPTCIACMRGQEDGGQ